jgi:hypothetical protein
MIKHPGEMLYGSAVRKGNGGARPRLHMEEEIGTVGILRVHPAKGVTFGKRTRQ